MSNINLRKDLELWCDFSSRYFDDQTNRIQDQSGYGRHPKASGGPTIGVEGPDDFEATSFDGSDDLFKATGFSGVFDTEISISVLVKPTRLGTDNFGSITGHEDFSTGFRKESNDTLDIRFSFDDGTNTGELQAYVLEERYQWITATWDSDTGNIIVIVDGERKELYLNEGEGKTLRSSPDFISVGGYAADNTNYLQGNIAAVGYHSRVLSRTEIKQLHSLTAPRRANL